MAIVIEDGSLVVGANSYITEDELIAYAEKRGVDVNDSLTTIIKAMDFFESHSNQFKGGLVSRDQALSWPRYDAVIEGWSWSSNEIPKQVLNSIYCLCVEIESGEDPFNPSRTSAQVIKKRVEGAIERQFAATSGGRIYKRQPSQTHIDLCLENRGLHFTRS